MYLNERYPKIIGHFCPKRNHSTLHSLDRLTQCGWIWHGDNTSFTLVHNPYWNWLMSAASSHDMLQINCLKFDVYTVVGCGPWWKAHNLLIDVCFSLEFSKVPLNSSTNTLRSFNNGDCCLNKKVNHVKVAGWKHSKIYNSITLIV
jgi:hypothetical protein